MKLNCKYVCLGWNNVCSTNEWDRIRYSMHAMQQITVSIDKVVDAQKRQTRLPSVLVNRKDASMNVSHANG